MTTKKSSKKSIKEIITGKPDVEQTTEQLEQLQEPESVIDTVSGQPDVEQPAKKKKRNVSQKRLDTLEKSRQTRIENEKKRQATQKRIDALRDKYNLSLSDVERELEAESSSDDESGGIQERQKQVQFATKGRIEW